ncbi:MAG: nickel-dependent lactate racemase [Clostridiaceae bacterium]|nr:nickel-dependent lactate racemase [Clostridiaceae bacterium]
MEFKLGFGKQQIAIDIAPENLMGVLSPNIVQVELTGEAEVRRALSAPIASAPLSKLVKAGEKVAIITSDITRPMPSKVVLPPLLEELYAAGVKAEDISIVFALGSHRKHTEEEMKYLVGEEVYNTIRCIDLDVNDCVPLGTTSSGTPVNIFRPVVEADRRICLGNIEYHYFAGYSGGAKAIMPGVSTREAIQKNHSMMVLDEAKAGAIDTNPLRQDIDEVAKFVPIDFILNVVLDEKKNIIKAVAGHYIEAHREGCRFLDSLYKVKIKEQADIVIVSAGGYPKDINLYQAQKALDNAKHAVREGGIVILVASCKEGLGEHVFERWMTTSESPGQMIDKIQQKFELGGHKAAAIAMVLKKARVMLVSDLDDDFVKSIFLEPYKDVNQAIEEAMKAMGTNAKIIVMPYGGSTLPYLEK